MLIVIVVYLSIGALLAFGLARKELFELVKEESLAAKISHFALWTIEAPVLFVYGVIKGIKN